MKIAIHFKTLKEILKSAALSKAKDLPVICDYMRVEARGGVVTWTATDLELASCYTVGGGLEDGAALVPVAALKEAAKCGGEVTIVHNGGDAAATRRRG